MSRKNFVFAIVAMTLMLMAGTALANEGFSTPVRVSTMGGDDPFNGYFLTDSNDAWSWFGRIHSNADQARVTWEGGGATASGFGLIKSEETYGAYMLHLQQGGTGLSGGEYNHFTLGYGYALEAFDIGVVYNRQNISWTTNTGGDDVEYSDAYNSFGFGITYAMDEETEIDAMFTFTSGEEDDGVDATDNEELSAMNFGVRAFRAMRDDVTVIPVFTFGTNTETMGDAETKMTDIGLGLAFDYVINDDNTLIVGGSWQNSKTEYDDGSNTTEVTTTTLPGVFGAVEHEFTDMFTLRMGATKNFASTEDADDINSDTVVEAADYNFGYTLGLGIAMGDWVIDLELNESWLYNFGYWVHGTPGGTPVAKIETKLFF